jgi:hypothetical protein
VEDSVVLGLPSNLLLEIDPVLNVLKGRGESMTLWFQECGSEFMQ